MKNIVCYLLPLLMFFISESMWAYDNNKLYQIVSAKYPDKAWSCTDEMSKVVLKPINPNDKNQLWLLVESRGPNRFFVNPYNNLAIRFNDGATTKVMEFNRMDVGQLWTTLWAGDYVRLQPTNKTKWVAAVDDKGNIIMVGKDSGTAKGIESLFRIKPTSNNIPLKAYIFSRLTKIENYKDYLKSNIENNINQWQQKGEFEPTSKWVERVNEKSRKKKIDELTIKFQDEYKEKVAVYNKRYAELMTEYYTLISKSKEEEFLKANFELMVYDADNQSFLINSDKQGDILMSVPLEEAPSFKQNWNTIKNTITPTFVPSGDDVVLTSVTVTNGNKKYVYDINTQAKYAVTDINYNFDPVEISIPDVADVNYTFDPVEVIQSTVVQTSPTVKGLQANNATIERKSIDATKQSDVDINIPQNATLKNSNTFVAIIANENYQRVSDVTFAANDGKLFAEYCTKALGLPQNHVMLYTDATLGNMLGAVNRMKEIGEAYSGKANIIFYYAGHGIPDETSKDAYLLPVDGDGTSVRTCYKQSELFAELASIKANSVVVFMDACFSGAQRGDGMLMAARGVAIKAKKSNPLGNMVVFSAAQGDETAYPYKEQRHGMFTYYLLKKLQETKGEATLGEISDYVTSEVRKQSIVVNGKMQTPTLTSSSAIGDAWRNWKLK